MSSDQRSEDQRPVGRTAEVGYEIGVSRTVDHPLDAVWSFLISPRGAGIWLGPGAVIGADRGDPYETSGGTRGELRSVRSHDRIRLTYRPRGRDAPTTVQMVVRPAADPSRTTVRVHQERLADGAERSAQREHWRDVLDRLAAGLDG